MSEVTKVLTSLEKFTGRQITKLGVRIIQFLTLSTPVDTGFARANWFMNGGSPLIRNHNPNEVELAKSLQKEDIDKTKLTYTIKQGSVFIVNNVPYIGDLNAGSSPQAESGFIEKNINNAIQSL